MRNIKFIITPCIEDGISFTFALKLNNRVVFKTKQILLEEEENEIVQDIITYVVDAIEGPIQDCFDDRLTSKMVEKYGDNFMNNLLNIDIDDEDYDYFNVSLFIGSDTSLIIVPLENSIYFVYEYERYILPINNSYERTQIVNQLNVLSTKIYELIG